ncbi:4-phosphoerythronate dehydrogenase [Reinekea sp.]|jgi:erythronate-4-phosphate dehydrogenase|uniref:4-phosphoerythronate dehydrogenase n=1 Tax=Reinekea sp. TaxID=1970455 RepID=UPI003988AE80
MQFNIVADENMPNVEPWFAPYAKSITRKAGRNLTAADLHQTDVLLVRSITQVNESLLHNTPVKFVGSATIGTDHIDQAYLSTQNIHFHHAPGCNAQSVTDWLLAVLSRLHHDHDVNWMQKVIGVIGVGLVGSTVVKRLEQLGCTLMVCDPLKHADGLLDQHQSMETLLSVCDIVCLHTPHTVEGLFPTDQMINAQALSKMRKGSWLINAGRGPVINEAALLSAISTQGLNVVLDVWPNEPTISTELLNAVYLASPHVAGYSLEGKYKGTEMLAHALAKTFQLTLDQSITLPVGPSIDARLFKKADIALWASEIVLALYDPARDTATMRISAGEVGIESDVFDALRKEYPTRREIASMTVNYAPEALANLLRPYGFNLPAAR